MFIFNFHEFNHHIKITVLYMMNDRDRIIYYTQKYKITNAIYDYEMNHFVELVYSGKDVNTHEYGMYLVSL